MKRNILTVITAILLFCGISWAVSAVLTRGLLRQYGLTRNADILILGHSHIMLALNAQLLQEGLGLTVAKYTREGVTIDERRLMAEHYFRLQPEATLQCVIYGVDPYLFTSEGLSKNSYLNFLPFMDDAAIDRYIRQNAPPAAYWRNKLLPLCRFSDAAINAGISGWVRQNGASLKTGTLDLTKTKAEIARGKLRAVKINPAAVQCFQDTIAMLTGRGIKVILLNTPIVDLYHQQNTEMYQKVETIFQDMANASEMIEYWDLNPGYKTRYELFRDPIHLNRNGQKEVTDLVLTRLKKELIGKK